MWPLCSRSARRSMNLLQLDEKWKLESCAHYLLKIASALFGGFGENRLAVYFHVMPLPHPLLVKSQCGTTWNSRISSPKREAIYRVPFVGCHQLVPYSNLVMRCLALLAISLSLAKCQCKFSLLLQWQLTILLLSLSLWLNLLPIWFISTKRRSIPHPTLTSISISIPSRNYIRIWCVIILGFSFNICSIQGRRLQVFLPWWRTLSGPVHRTIEVTFSSIITFSS